MSARTIVVLGGGVGGIVAANELRRRLSREHRVIMVERETQHAFAPSFLWVMTGDRQTAQVTRPLSTLLRPGIDLVHAEVQRIDVTSHRVTTGRGELTYDYLIIALGAELAPETVPGLAGNAHTFYTLEGAGRLRDALRLFSGGRVAVAIAGTPYKCPGAPHEGAMLLAAYLERRGLSKTSEVHLFTPEPQPMPVAGPELGEMVRQMLESKGIRFHPLHRLSSVRAETQELVFESGDAFRYDLLVAIPPHRVPQAVAASGLVDASGWVPVERQTLQTRFENVYAIGDVAAISIPGRWKADVPMMLPKAGVFAHAQAEVVARRIAAEVSGDAAHAAFYGGGYCMLEAGEGLAGFAFGNFFGEPTPQVTLKQVGKAWHVGKVLFEKWWLSPPGMRRRLLRGMIRLGARMYGIPQVV